MELRWFREADDDDDYDDDDYISVHDILGTQ